MKYFACIIAFGNLLGFLSQAGGIWLNFLRAPAMPLWAVLINILALAVFLSQRSYAWLIVRRLTQEVSGEYVGPKPVSPFDFWTEWMESRPFPWLLLAGNLILAGVSVFFVHSYLELQRRLEGAGGIIQNPLSNFLWGLGFYNAGLVAVNILFGILVVSGGWRRVYFQAMAALLVVGLGVTTYVTAPDQIRLNRARSAWPKSDIVTLPSGESVSLAPPPGYIRVPADDPALMRYLDRYLHDLGGGKAVVLAVFAADARSYKRIIKNLDKPLYSYKWDWDLAWIVFEPQIQTRYTADPEYTVDPDKTLAERMRVAPDEPGTNPPRTVSGPAYYLGTTGSVHKRPGELAPMAYTVHLYGHVIVSGRLLSVRSAYGVMDQLDDEQRLKWLGHSRRWVEALAGANPSTTVEAGLEGEASAGYTAVR